MHFFILFFICITHSTHADCVIGKLKKNGNTIILTTPESSYILTGEKNILKESRSLIKFNTLVNAAITKANKNPVQLLTTPIIQTGAHILKGPLRKKNNQYFIGSHTFTFQDAIPCYNSHFDKKSIAHYIGKKVLALANWKQEHYVVTSLIEDNLYSSAPSTFTLPKNSKKIASKFPKGYLSKTIFSKKISEDHPSYRMTIIDNQPILKSDEALVITLGGRTGDDFEAQAGHITLGTASITESGDLNIEMFNFYPRFEEKAIIPGHTHFIDFFGGITMGQINYRPNYTLIIYGIDAKKLARIRLISGKALHYMRSSNDPVGLTHNCTTTAWSALNSAKIFGAHDANPANQYPPYFRDNALRYTPDKYGLFNTLKFAFSMSSAAEVSPRQAYESLIKNLHKFNAKRIDFIFHQQIPSGRPQGGAPCRTISDLAWFIWLQKKISTKKRTKKIQKWIDKMILLRRQNDGHSIGYQK